MGRLEKIFSKKVLLGIIIFIFGIVITSPSFLPSHALDSYCTINVGYFDTALWFLVSGRVFSALFFMLFDLIKLPFDWLGIIAIFLSNIILGITIYRVYRFILEISKISNKIMLILLLISCILFFYNPMMLEILIFDESFVMCMGILLMVEAAIYFYKAGFKNYVISFLCCFIGAICYQGIVCYFLPLCFLFIAIKYKGVLNKEIFRDIIKKGLIALLIYGCSLLGSLLVIKICLLFLNEDNSKLGNLNLLFNIKYVIKTLIPKTLKELFGFANRKIFYGFLFGVLVGIIIKAIINFKTNKYSMLFVLMFLILSVFFAFAPNFVVNSTSNYTAARMCGSIGSMSLGLVIIFCTIYKPLKGKMFIIDGWVLIVCLGCFLYNGYNYFYNNYVDLLRYDKDMDSIRLINKEISQYEKETHKKVKTIYYATDSWVEYYYYDLGLTNGYNVRLYACDWGMECAINAYRNKNDKYKYKKMSVKDKEKYFNTEENYTDFSKEQFVFVDEVLYLLIY